MTVRTMHEAETAGVTDDETATIFIMGSPCSGGTAYTESGVVSAIKSASSSPGTKQPGRRTFVFLWSEELLSRMWRQAGITPVDVCGCSL